MERQFDRTRWRRWGDAIVLAVATVAWLALASGPEVIEFDPPLLRALLMGSALLLGLPGLLGRPLRWDGYRGLGRAGVMVSASYTACWIEMVLVLQWHALAMQSGNVAAAGEAIPSVQELLQMRLIAGLPWIAAIVLGCRHGLVPTASGSHAPTAPPPPEAPPEPVGDVPPASPPTP